MLSACWCRIIILCKLALSKVVAQILYVIFAGLSDINTRRKILQTRVKINTFTHNLLSALLNNVIGYIKG